MISVLILTKNEQADIADCIRSVSWSNDIHVLDSFSNDDTVAIARSNKAVVRQRPFTSYADQRNSGLHDTFFSNEWVLILDADERATEALAMEIASFVERVSVECVAARIRRRDFLMGKWLKHSQISPLYIRLVRPRKVRYIRDINEVLIPDGVVAELRESFDHFPFSKGISFWLDRHNRYSSMEASRAIAEAAGAEKFSWRSALFARDFNVRRFHQKGLFFRMPGRPLLKLFYMLIIRRGILDGRAGITYCLLQAIYEYFIVIKQRELRLAAQGTKL